MFLQKKRGVWIKLPIAFSNLVEPTVKVKNNNYFTWKLSYETGILWLCFLKFVLLNFTGRISVPPCRIRLPDARKMDS